MKLDYVTYHITRHVPNPLQCYQCGLFGHTAERCTKNKVCLRCGLVPHEGGCAPHCVNCGKEHSCQDHVCDRWMKEKEICRIKVEEEISFSAARKLYDDRHEPPPILRSYANTVRTPSAANDDELKEKVTKLESKMSEMVALLERLLTQRSTSSTCQISGSDGSTLGGRLSGKDGDGQESQNTMETLSIHNRQSDEDDMDDLTQALDASLPSEVEGNKRKPTQPRNSASSHGSTAPQGSSGTGDDAGPFKPAKKDKSNKGGNKNKQKQLMLSDEISPSPPILRPTKPNDRTGVSRDRSTSLPRKSWTDPPKSAQGT
ncbi:uncharacterized protein LOC122393965 [Amphibalanus amphitrite]|uniref:uncharacterized protein LOC122393965 n=1 Tax=Amphibalanus amphitrite TaxID=1232801 RepID=UPI001C926D95|nr:uncharacterized protein LOC122393965 [Amphibalanus amphitrite]